MAVNVYVGARPSGEVETKEGGPHSRKISRLFGVRKKYSKYMVLGAQTKMCKMQKIRVNILDHDHHQHRFFSSDSLIFF